MLESFGRQKEAELEQRKAHLKDEIMVLWNQNLQLMNLFSHSSHPEEVELRMLQEYYPELFKEEAENAQAEMDEKKKKEDMELHKARMEEYAFRHNLALKERGESSGGHDT